MKRREFVAVSGSALAFPSMLRAQQPAAKLTLGILTPHPAPTPEERAKSPVFGWLKKLGWVIDQNLALERPDAGGREELLPRLAEELAWKRVDVIWTIGPESAVAAARATTSIPIVMWGVPYPVEQGLIDSYARPGRNVTGTAFFTGVELISKVLELLKEIVPGAKRVASIRTPSVVITVKGERYEQPRELVEAAAQKLGFDYRWHPVRRSEDFDSVFAAILESGAEALMTAGTTTTFRERRRIADFANRNRLPSAFNQREFVEAGGLFSYGADTWETIRQSLGYVDRILRGAKPRELPVELPSRYELVLNLKTANMLALTFPQSLLLRADRVIE